MENIKILFLFTSFIIFTSCGDLFMKSNSGNEVNFDQFATCELDFDAFSKILEQNIKGDIVCLKEKLDLFIDVVETDRPGEISKATLKDFILNGPIDVDEEILDIIDSVFDLSNLIMATDRNYLTRTDVAKLLDFLEYFNDHIWKSYKYFRSNDDVDFNRHKKERQIIFNEFALIANKLKTIYVPSREDVDRIDTYDFLENFFKKEPDTLEKIKSALFLKRAFLGGDPSQLTHFEFFNLLQSLPYLGQVVFDLIKTENFEFSDDQELLIKIFLADIEVLRNELYYDASSHEAVFNVEDIIKLITTFAPDMLGFDISKYPREILKLKEVILGDGGQFFSSRELITLMDHGQNVLDEADLFFRAYKYYKDQLDSPDPITKDLTGFEVLSSREANFHQNFSRIANKYKFLKGGNSTPYFTHDFNRNANAFFEIGAFEYLIKLAMEHYGRKNPNARGGFHMTLEETVTLIDDFKWFLKDQGIITIGRKGGGEVANVADNLVLMSTLFQFQSNGCDSENVCMEVPEITEFVIGLLTALDVKDFFTDTMLTYCQNELDQFDRINPECFRRNFINVIEEPIPEDGRSLADYMPHFYDYLNDLIQDIPQGAPITESKNFMHFITETEAFTRSCTFYDAEKTEEVWLKSNDAFAVFAGLLNVESTLLRFDVDRSNKLDYRNAYGKNEVLNAYYDVYEGAIKALVAPNGGFMEKLSKPIYQYLIKYGKVPDQKKFKSIWHFVKFLFKRNKSADAKRATVSTILKTLGEQSENAAKHPYKCEECFRDPTVQCEPEDDTWD